MTLNNQSSKEIQQLSKPLLENSFTADIIEANYDLLPQVLRDSKSGIERPLYNQRYSPIEGGYVGEPTYEADGIHPKHETVWDPVEIFRMHKNAREGHRREHERKAREWKDRVEREWYLYERSVSNDYASRLYDKDGRYVTKQWFYENQSIRLHGMVYR